MLIHITRWCSMTHNRRWDYIWKNHIRMMSMNSDVLFLFSTSIILIAMSNYIHPHTWHIQILSRTISQMTATCISLDWHGEVPSWASFHIKSQQDIYDNGQLRPTRFCVDSAAALSLVTTLLIFRLGFNAKLWKSWVCNSLCSTFLSHYIFLTVYIHQYRVIALSIYSFSFESGLEGDLMFHWQVEMMVFSKPVKYQLYSTCLNQFIRTCS